MSFNFTYVQIYWCDSFLKYESHEVDAEVNEVATTAFVCSRNSESFTNGIALLINAALPTWLTSFLK